MTIELTEKQAEILAGCMVREVGWGTEVYDNEQLAAFEDVYYQINEKSLQVQKNTWIKSITDFILTDHVFQVGRSLSKETIKAVETLATCIIDDITRQTLKG